MNVIYLSYPTRCIYIHTTLYLNSLSHPSILPTAQARVDIGCPDPSLIMEPIRLKKCTDLWFPDGTVIIRAAYSSHAYRVYQGMLSAQSAMFNDLFTRAQGDVKYENCPIVDFYDDHADLEAFLRAILDWR